MRPSPSIMDFSYFYYACQDAVVRSKLPRKCLKKSISQTFTQLPQAEFCSQCPKNAVSGVEAVGLSGNFC